VARRRSRPRRRPKRRTAARRNWAEVYRAYCDQRPPFEASVMQGTGLLPRKLRFRKDNPLR
ncbi:MAG: hypothetical protein ACXWVS_11095, partial [Hyphomicrobium sp.]